MKRTEFFVGRIKKSTRALVWLGLLALVANGVALEVAAVTPTENPSYVRYSSPEVLSYAELTELLRTGEPEAELQAKLNRLLTTPFLSNEAHYRGATPHRPSSPTLGPFWRVGLWNIERGLRLEEIKLAFTHVEGLRERLETYGVAPDRIERALEEARLLQQADVIVINESDLGIKRTGYRDVTRELAESLHMNYAFGVQFVEVDPISLGIETFEELPAEDREELERDISVDRERYRGLHGVAVLSRYPIRSARVIPFQAKPYDWYQREKKRGLSPDEATPSLAGRMFLRKATRKIRRGGRMMLMAELDVPDLPEKAVTVVTTHLENRCAPKGRQQQMRELLDQIREIRHPVILAGDLNTSGRDRTPVTVRRLLWERFVNFDALMRRGVQSVIRLNLSYVWGPLGMSRTHTDPTVRNIWIFSPNRERGLFTMIEKMRFADGHQFDFRGDAERTVNRTGKTLANSNQRSRKGFEPTWELDRPVGPLGQFKLDWILVKSYLKHPRDKKGSYRFAPHYARTLKTLNTSLPGRFSDHHPMIVDLPFGEPSITDGK
jgi:endonuclease/exonuclease/phosphatase family metal-dependent hydrolase